MLNWRYHPDAIGPGNNDEGCFSRGAFVDDDSSAILSYWMLWSDKGIGLAKSTDHNFNQWEKFGNNPCRLTRKQKWKRKNDQHIVSPTVVRVSLEYQNEIKNIQERIVN